MKINSLELFHIRLPLQFLFKTSKTTLQHRETLIVKTTDELGNIGYGEVVSFSEPFYSKEILQDSKQILVNRYFPLILQKEIQHPFDIHSFIQPEFPMALAGLENSLVDAYAKRNQVPFMKLLFNEPLDPHISSGVVLGDLEISTLLQQIEKYISTGITRIKVKISPQTADSKIKSIRKHFPTLQLLVDANQSFTLEDLSTLQNLDQYHLLCIEEPLSTTDLLQYHKLQQKLNTPLCLDESIVNIEHLKEAIRLKAFQVLNVKVGRVGGLLYTKKMIELCRMSGIKYWIGSMLESGISKILHVHLASLTDTFIPGDLSCSRRYFEEDLIEPEIKAVHGQITVPNGPGLGITIKENVLKKYSIEHLRFKR